MRARLIIALTLLLITAALAQNIPAVNSPASQILGASQAWYNRRGALASVRGVDFNTTADQAIGMPTTVTAFTIDRILVTNCSRSMTLAIGGFYPTTSKGGTPIVAATQVYSALTGAAVTFAPTLSATALTTRYTLLIVYFALTTAQGSAGTCDIYLEGLDLT